MKVKVEGIKWEADNMEDVAHLENTMILDVPICIIESEDFEDALEEFISDELSNETGFTHEGWSGHEIIES